MRTFARLREELRKAAPTSFAESALQRKPLPIAEQPPAQSTPSASSHSGHALRELSIFPPVSRAIQTKVAISQPGDIYEQEADRLADQVATAPSPRSSDGAAPQIQRLSGPTGGQVEETPVSVQRTLERSGSPLEPALRQDMEQRFGHDFSRVRVHSGTEAEQSAGDIHAAAYTVGKDIVFGAGQFIPGTHEGRRLLAHELTHVVQQDPHRPLIQRQPVPPGASPTASPLLTPGAAAVAVADVTRRYDEDSIRTLETFSNRPPDGVFDAADADAFANLQQQLRVTPSGKADVPSINAMLRIAGPTAAIRSALIHLVIDSENLDVSSALNVVYEPSISMPSDTDTLSGGVSTIQIGNSGFTSYQAMVTEIKKQLAVTPTASPVTPVPAAVLPDPTIQQAAIAFGKSKLSDRRSIRLLQGTLGSKVTGQWDVELVRHVAAKQQAAGMISWGLLDDLTLGAIAKDMVGKGEHDGVLQLIVDYYDLDRSHAFNVVFNPNTPPNPDAEAETQGLGPGSGAPQVVQIFAGAFAQPFPNLVHTVAHELGHVQQMIQGVGSLNVREFLSEGIEIESKGMPEELLESDADIDLMIRGTKPTNPGFIQDVQRMLHFWRSMSLAEKRANHQRFKALRMIIINRINQGSATQQSKLAPFIPLLQAADNGV